MSFSLLANICVISPLDLELFFNVLRVSTLFLCCHSQQLSRPVAPSYLCLHWDISFPMPCRRRVRVASHHCRLPNPVVVPIIPPAPSSRPLMMSRLFPLLLGHFPSYFLLTILYSGVLCRLWGQLYGSLP
jgi:hypothetical protein